MRLIIALLFLITIPNESRAEYVAPGHHVHHQWYKDIQQQLGISGCCDEHSQDCGPVGSDFRDLGNNIVIVLLEDGKWYDVVGADVFYVMTPDGGAHVCRQPNGYYYYSEGKGSKFFFFCVFLPIPGV